MTHEEWKAKGLELFGPDHKQWKFVCPICGYVASLQDYLDAGVPHESIAFSCIGRWLPKSISAFGGEDVRGNGPCDYAGHGLFRFNPLEVDGVKYFNFAEPEADYEHEPNRNRC